MKEEKLRLITVFSRLVENATLFFDGKRRLRGVLLNSYKSSIVIAHHKLLKLVRNTSFTTMLIPVR